MARTRLYPPSVDPGFPKLPPTPVGWKRTTFGELLEVVERPIRLEPDKTYRLVVAKRSRGGIELRREVLGREILTKTQFEAKAGDFLISRRQIIHGACGVVPDELDGAVVSNEYVTIRTRPGLLMDFLRYYSHSSYFQRTCFHSSHGVDVEKMIFKLEDWLKREFDVPPVPEQEKITAILSSVDEAIAATEAVINQLQVVKKAMMGELLTKGIPGRHSRFKKTEIGEVPEGWGVAAAGDILADGPTNGRSPRARATPPGVLTFSIGAVRDGKVDIEGNLKYAEGRIEDLRSAIVRPGDILIVRGNGNRDLIGRCGRVEAVPGECIYPDILMRVRVGERMLPEFFNVLWNSDLVRAQILDKAKTTNGTYKINGQDVRSIVLPVPPLAEQQEIADAIDAVSKRVSVEEEKRRWLYEVKSALLSVLLTGEVRVR